jgi:hypothetical protein
MALLNNFAEASYAQGEYGQCQRSLSHLRNVCDTVLGQERFLELDMETLHLLEWHRKLFLYNALMLEEPPTLAPAA